jgi:hypothetical protein
MLWTDICIIKFKTDFDRKTRTPCCLVATNSRQRGDREATTTTTADADLPAKLAEIEKLAFETTAESLEGGGGGGSIYDPIDSPMLSLEVLIDFCLFLHFITQICVQMALERPSSVSRRYPVSF